MLTRAVLLQMAGSKKMETFVRRNTLAARVASRFVAGESLEQVTAAVRALNQKGMLSTLDFLGESVTTEDEVAVVVDTYLRLFQLIRSEKLNANVSVKLTALGLDIGDDLAERNMIRLLQAAGSDQFIRIDMEGSPFTQRTLDLFYRLWDGTPPMRNVGVVIQAYLHRSADDIQRLIRAGARVRLCKGAYKEPETVAFQDKADVDTNYVALMRRLLKDGHYPGIATHDSAMIDATKQYARENSIDSSRFEFQMLYGVRRELQEQLVQEGYNVRVYTPFGDHWYPYFMRRLAERPANLWFAVNSIFRG
jgi:proline dehydrogenase